MVRSRQVLWYRAWTESGMGPLPPAGRTLVLGALMAAVVAPCSRLADMVLSPPCTTFAPKPTAATAPIRAALLKVLTEVFTELHGGMGTAQPASRALPSGLHPEHRRQRYTRFVLSPTAPTACFQTRWSKAGMGVSTGLRRKEGEDSFQVLEQSIG